MAARVDEDPLASRVGMASDEPGDRFRVPPFVEHVAGRQSSESETVGRGSCGLEENRGRVDAMEEGRRASGAGEAEIKASA